MIFRLESERLLLRQFQESDLESFLAYRNDPDVARYQGWDIPYSRERAKNFVAAMCIAEPATPGEWFQMAVELKSTNEMIGDLGFQIQEEDAKQAAIGYSLARPYWGQRYAFEAVWRLLVFLFEDLQLHRVMADCDVENTSSWKLLERLGFRREAHFVENTYIKGAYGSEYNYAMLGREWRQRRTARRSETDAE